MSFHLQNNNQLIRNQQNYYLERKLLTIHTEDRDSNKWQNENEFEITLPEPLTNVQSMRLIEGTFPSNYYTFSEKNKNTKFYFDIDVSANSPYEASGNYSIQEGFYTGEQMAMELETVLQRDICDNNLDPIKQTRIRVFYDKVGQRFYFGTYFPKDVSKNVILDFKREQEYNTGCNNIDILNRNTKWGLGYYLGFDKKVYDSSGDNTEWIFNNDSNIENVTFFNYLTPNDLWYNDFSMGFPERHLLTGTRAVLKAPYTAKLNGEQCFYVEIDKYNNCDELKPYSQLTNSLYNNDFNGNVNAAFAKIPIMSTPNSEFRISENDILQNFSQFNPPLERISKLKFKFRYHDGRLVDFKKHEFNFTMEFNILRPEIQQTYNVRTPAIVDL